MTEPENSWGSEHAEDREEARKGRLHSALAIESLVSANQESNATMLSLVESVRRETAARDRKVDSLEKSQRMLKKATLVGVVAICFVLILGVINAFNLNTTRQTSQDLKRTNQILLDCINTEGDCGRINTANQKILLDEIKKYNLIGFYCIRNNPGASDPRGENFLKCMERLYPNGPTLEQR